MIGTGFLGRIRKTEYKMGEKKKMSIKAQAEKIGFQIVGSLVRCMDREPSHLYQCFFDEAENEYILHRGILTIVAADGRVY